MWAPQARFFQITFEKTISMELFQNYHHQRVSQSTVDLKITSWTSKVAQIGSRSNLMT